MNNKDEILDCNIHFAAFSKRLPSQFIQVKLTVAYLKKMTGFHEYIRLSGLTLALFSGFPTVQFWITCSMQNGGGRSGPFYHVNDISVS